MRYELVTKIQEDIFKAVSPAESTDRDITLVGDYDKNDVYTGGEAGAGGLYSREDTHRAAKKIILALQGKGISATLDKYDILEVPLKNKLRVQVQFYSWGVFIVIAGVAKERGKQWRLNKGTSYSRIIGTILYAMKIGGGLSDGY